MPRALSSPLVGILLPMFFAPALPAADLGKDAHGLLEKYCTECHGPRGSGKGGFDYVLDRDRLIARGQVTPTKADDSPLLQRVRDGDMPPGKRPKPSAAEIALLGKWIDSGAAPFVANVPTPAPRDYAALHKIVYDDLNSLDPRSRRFTRYLTLSPLAVAGLAPEELDKHRHALTKLVNSLSWNPRLRCLHAVDDAATTFRLDLRDYKWNARTWDKLAATYPYRLPESSETTRTLSTLAGCEQPLLRGDWFAATAARPPLYFDFLQLPATDRGLERLLQVDVPGNQQDDTATRIGFNGSGVARGNRVLERHDSVHGAYWRSYDFNDNTSRQNIFQNPVTFQAAGGEIIFNLPNGLQGYMLVDSAGRRVDKAPGEIVGDTKRPDKLVETGISCMSCHVRGILPKDDQVRAHILKNPATFTKAERESALALYAPAAKMRSLMKEDSERFTAALKKLGIPVTDQDPIEAAVLRYEDTLDLRAAAAEAGMEPEAFAAGLRKAPGLNRSLGALLARGGTVQRQLFEETFPELARSLHLGRPPVTQTVTAIEPFVGHRGTIHALAISADGRTAATGGEDRIVRIWDLDTGKQLAALEGHSDDIEAVAFTPDGKRVLSGGVDRTLRLWDIASGKEVHRLLGHTDGIRTIAITKDGRRAWSGGSDRTLRVWDLERGQEIRSLTGHDSAVTCLVLSPDGTRVLSGSNDRSVRLWDVKSSKEIAKWDGHEGGVLSVAFSSDGKRALSGGSDRTVRLWDVAGGKEIRKMTGHANAVVCVAFLPDGRAISASSRYQTADAVVRVWDLDKGKEQRSFDVPDLDRVENAVFVPDRNRALISHSTGGLRLVPLDK